MCEGQHLNMFDFWQKTMRLLPTKHVSKGRIVRLERDLLFDFGLFSFSFFFFGGAKKKDRKNNSTQPQTSQSYTPTAPLPQSPHARE